MREFPHLQGAPAFPGAGREVYEQIKGAYDSGEWTEGAKITLLSVPWGVYDPTTQTDVPGFDTEEERDRWFANYVNMHADNEAHTLDTLVRYQIKGYVDLPFTFDYAYRYNYMIVDYPKAPVSYGANGLDRMFFHITSIDYDSPSCTRVGITPDWWTTCIPLMQVNHMILERGHAPVAATNTDTYLKDPINNSGYLLSADVDFGSSKIVSHAKDIVFNDGTVYALLCMRGCYLTGSWDNYAVPRWDFQTIDGQQSRWTCAIKASDLQAFLNTLQDKAPQAFAQMECIALVGEKLLALSSKTAVFGYEAWVSVAGASKTEAFDLTKDRFGYPANVADLAKLYTYPYAHIEVTDELGNVTEVRVEEVSGSRLKVEYAFNAAFPALKLSANISNAGGSNRSITFKNATAHDMRVGGTWYGTLKSWDIPCFTVSQSSYEAHRYMQHYNMEQAKKNADVAYTNATASNATAKTNADTSADTGKTNADASADTGYTNATASNATAYTNAENNAAVMTQNNALTVAANTAMTTRSNNGSKLSAERSNTKIRVDAGADAAMSSASYDANKDALGVASTNNMASAVTAGANAIASTATGAAAGAAAGSLAAGVGAVPGAVLGGMMGLMNATVSYATAQSSNSVSQSNSSALYGASIDNIGTKTSAATSYATDNTATACSVASDNTSTTNETSTAIANNNANNATTNASNNKTTGDANAARSRDTTKANATRSRDTSKANAQRSKDTGDANAKRSKDNAYAAIQAAWDNSRLQPNKVWGTERNSSYNSTRAQMLSVNVVTESKNAIAQAGAQFKRWGYTLNQTWELKTWNLMKHFTFWQVSDIWATGTGAVPEEGQDTVRNMLYTGVTCWKDPAEIGKVSIYDN